VGRLLRLQHVRPPPDSPRSACEGWSIGSGAAKRSEGWPPRRPRVASGLWRTTLMKSTLMKTTWWCLASPGAAPRAVGADSRESEPRRQSGIYGTLVERASTPRTGSPLVDALEGGARRLASAERSTEVVDQSIAKRASWGKQIQRTDDLKTNGTANGRFVRERVPVSFRASQGIHSGRAISRASALPRQPRSSREGRRHSRVHAWTVSVCEHPRRRRRIFSSSG
jgi:hypothetical protein